MHPHALTVEANMHLAAQTNQPTYRQLCVLGVVNCPTEREVYARYWWAHCPIPVVVGERGQHALEHALTCVTAIAAGHSEVCHSPTLELDGHGAEGEGRF